MDYVSHDNVLPYLSTNTNNKTLPIHHDLYPQLFAAGKRERQREKERDRERKRETVGEGERQTERQRDQESKRERKRDTY